MSQILIFFQSHSKWVLMLIVVSFLIGACSDKSTKPKSPSRTENIRSELQKMLDDHYNKRDFPGVVLSVKIDGEDEINIAAGVSQIENEVPATPTDRFRIASITKTFTAATILKLHEDELLDIDHTIKQYVPDLNIPFDTAITIRQLLNHTSGLADHENSPSFVPTVLLTLLQDPNHIFPQSLLIDMALEDGFHFNPGEGFSYTNTGYVILGLIIESVTGTTYSAAVHSLIIDPLGLNNTFVPLPDDESIPGEYLHGYGFIENELMDQSHANHSWAFAEGEMISNTGDLTIWMKKLVGGDVFDKPETAQTMQSFIDTGEGVEYGLGLVNNPFLGIGHDGRTLGYQSEVYYNPNQGILIAIGISTTLDETIIYDVLNIINQNLD